uniref:Uncharacterized protein n=1 Tax=Ascaris lumbricoides TaxID=6252 RepID=A0A0M3I0T0_ASCLU
MLHYGLQVCLSLLWRAFVERRAPYEAVRRIIFSEVLRDPLGAFACQKIPTRTEDFRSTGVASGALRGRLTGEVNSPHDVAAKPSWTREIEGI